MGLGGILTSGMGMATGLIGANQTRGGNQAALNAENEAARMLAALEGQMPTVEAQKLVLQMLSQTGEYSPEMIQALTMGPSAMQGVTADSNILDAQSQSLNDMVDMSKTGLTEADEAAAREIQRGVANSDVARRKAILNDMAMRGTLGSGQELAMQMQGAQDATNTQASQNDKLIQDALQRKISAVNNVGNMSSSMRSQDVSEKTNKARAADTINQFNTNNQQQAINTNVQNKNIAQKSNLDTKQRIADSNVDLTNQQQQYNKKLLVDEYNRKLELAKARAGQQSKIGAAAKAKGDANADAISRIGGGLTNIVGSQK